MIAKDEDERTGATRPMNVRRASPTGAIAKIAARCGKTAVRIATSFGSLIVAAPRVAGQKDGDDGRAGIANRVRIATNGPNRRTALVPTTLVPTTLVHIAAWDA